MAILLLLTHIIAPIITLLLKNGDSPVYYFAMTAQMQAAIQRVYCIGKPQKAKKAALLLSSGSPGTHDGSIAQFKAYMAYANIEVAGIITAVGEENKSEAKLNEIRDFAKGL